ncbi:MAG: lactate utilization protein [Candidatus Woesearchaeota archaeon]
MDALARTIASLERNRIKAHRVHDKLAAKDLVLSMISKSDVVGAGGSTTLEQCGIIDAMANYNFLDWFVPGIELQKKFDLRRQTLVCDVFLSSANAVTEDGKIVNIDGGGNRVAAMLYGPKKVILVVGKNKITKNLDDAIDRVRNVAAPLNCKRLNKNTPCVETGRCSDCSSPDRICSSLVILEAQQLERISVIIVDEELGF